MNNKDPAVHVMALELAARRSTIVTDAVRQALRAELERIGVESGAQEAEARSDSAGAAATLQAFALAGSTQQRRAPGRALRRRRPAGAKPMVIDTSALQAILKVESGALAFVDALKQPGPRHLCTATLLETRIVVERQLGPAGQAELDLLLSRAAITAVPLEELHVHWALGGWRRYGKGRHRAGLNLGDCFSYGLVMALKAPLLFKGTGSTGSDFATTDIKRALPS